MNKWRLLAKYGAIGCGISLVLIILAYLATIWLIDQSALVFDRRSSHTSALREVLATVPPGERAERLHELASQQQHLKGFKTVYLLGEGGKILYPPQAKDFARSPLPESKLSIEGFSETVLQSAPRLWLDLPGEPKQYLLVERTPMDAALFGRRFTATFLVLSLALFLGVMSSITIIFYLLRDRAQLGLDVMNRMKLGDLRARYPVTKVDEFAQNSLVFNQMADEIENLVTSLRNAESSRSGLLRELAHDLRTPIAGLKSVLETLHDNAGKLPQDKIDRLMELAEREVDYFGSLVDDLLILGTLDEPSYSSETEPVSVADLVHEELTIFSERFPKLKFELAPAPFSAEVIGIPKLLRRAIRNSLENASFYAKTKVTAQIAGHKGGGGELRLLVEDDGPGFSEAELAQFGKKRPTRTVSGPDAKRISVGLGSVIMRSIVERHSGHVTPMNLLAADGRNSGARIEFIFPLKQK
ncbi:MAG: ATP-binding protein [Bdellovibrionota bacterium]